MRIATSTLYEQQATSINNLSSQYQLVGHQLSTGKSLNAPGDDPTVVAQDLTLRQTIAGQQGDVSNASAAQNELTFVDSTLSSLTDILSHARSLTVASATDIIPNGAQRQDQAAEVQGLLEQALGLANAQYGNRYIFAGTTAGTLAPVTPQGSPPQSVLFTGNLDTRVETINGQPFRVGTTMQQAFNVQSTDGTPDVFQLLANLRNTMNNATVSTVSGQPVNQPGQSILGVPAAAPTTLGQLAATAPQVSNVVLRPDNTGQYSITINGVNPGTGAAQSQTFTFTNATAIDDGTAASVVGQINAASAAIGVSASWNNASQRMTITSTVNGGNSPFTVVDDVSAPGGTTANFMSVFHLQSQGDTINTLSTQIGDFDRVVNNLLKTRADLGERIQSLASQGTQIAGQATDNHNILSSYEDTDVGAATSKFTQIQTALQAAYAVTSRLEGHSLLDYLH
jgi:flagellar hook-associated protein 3 FlgL